MTSGDIALASGFNSLFTRLEALRKKHLNKDGQTSAANTALSTAFTTNVAVTGQRAVVNNVQALKNNLTTLGQSTWLDSSFASKITVPAVGDLIEAVDFNTWGNVIGAMESICANYSKYSKSYSDNYNQTYFNGYDHYG